MSFLDKMKSAVTKAETHDGDEATDLQVRVADPKLEKRIDDILELLQITDTFEIPAEVFLPEDLKDVQFDLQIPSGYDTGQVTRFVHQARGSVKFLVELLKKRNEDIAKLATMIDKLQVDVNNQKFEAEIANGISVMATEDDPSLENKLMEAKLEIRRLEDQIKYGTGTASGLTDEERESYGALQDELSLAHKMINKLEDSNLHLKGQVAHLEEQLDDLSDDPNQFVEPKPLTEAELAALGLPSLERKPAPSKAALPATSTIEMDNSSYSLPPRKSGHNAFDLDDE